MVNIFNEIDMVIISFSREFWPISNWRQKLVQGCIVHSHGSSISAWSSMIIIPWRRGSFIPHIRIIKLRGIVTHMRR